MGLAIIYKEKKQGNVTAQTCEKATDFSTRKSSCEAYAVIRLLRDDVIAF